MGEFIGALDLGTTSNRFVIFDRRGRIVGTRELVFPGLPYIVAYRIKDQIVDIVRIYHGAQDWP